MDLEQRVAELEQRTNRYRNALVVLVVGVCAVAVVGATTDDGVIRGSELVIKNDVGRVIIRAGSDTEDNGRLTMNSKTGKTRISLGSSKDDTGFWFSGYNKTDESVVTLGVDDYGNGEIGAWNRKGKGRTLKPGP
jgi:hypothetical protein